MGGDVLYSSGPRLCLLFESNWWICCMQVTVRRASNSRIPNFSATTFHSSIYRLGFYIPTHSGLPEFQPQGLRCLSAAEFHKYRQAARLIQRLNCRAADYPRDHSRLSQILDGCGYSKVRLIYAVLRVVRGHSLHPAVALGMSTSAQVSCSKKSHNFLLSKRNSISLRSKRII